MFVLCLNIEKNLKILYNRRKEGKEVFMRKEERLEEITKLINKRGTIRVTEVVERLKVSDMTVRRLSLIHI